MSQLTDADKLGTLFGLFESIEKLAGIGGPLLGGVLAQVRFLPKLMDWMTQMMDPIQPMMAV